MCVQVLLSHSGVPSSWVNVREEQQQTSYKVNTRAYTIVVVVAAAASAAGGCSAPFFVC